MYCGSSSSSLISAGEEEREVKYFYFKTSAWTWVRYVIWQLALFLGCARKQTNTGKRKIPAGSLAKGQLFVNKFNRTVLRHLIHWVYSIKFTLSRTIRAFQFLQRAFLPRHLPTYIITFVLELQLHSLFVCWTSLVGCVHCPEFHWLSCKQTNKQTNRRCNKQAQCNSDIREPKPRCHIFVTNAQL